MACALASTAPSALAATGDINTVAGNGFAGYAGDGGQATAAQMTAPAGVAFGSAGDLFIADFYAHTVRKVAPGGVITTAAGTGSAGGAIRLHARACRKRRR